LHQAGSCIAPPIAKGTCRILSSIRSSASFHHQQWSISSFPHNFQSGGVLTFPVLPVINSWSL
jgi:hypothetical protein